MGRAPSAAGAPPGKITRKTGSNSIMITSNIVANVLVMYAIDVSDMTLF